MTVRSGVNMGTVSPLSVAPITRVGDVQMMLTVYQIANGYNRGVNVQEATQSVAKHFAVVIRDPASGLGMALTSAVVSGLTVQIKKGGLTSYAVITPTLTIVGSTGLLDIALTASHLDTLGIAAVNITGPGVLPNDDLFVDVITLNKTDSVRAGLTALPNAAAAAAGGLPTLGGAIPNVTAGANGGLPLQGSAVPNANAGANGGLPTLGAAIPNVTAGANGGLPLQGGAVPNANAGAAGGLPTVGATIPNAAAGASGGLPTLGGAIPNATAGTSSGLPTKQNVDDDASAVIAAVNAHTDSALGGVPTAASVRDAVLNALLSDHATPGTIADGVALAAGLLQGNFLMDDVDNSNPNGQTAARLRVFRSGTDVAAATPGGTSQGEFATFIVTTTYAAPGKITSHKVVRQ